MQFKEQIQSPLGIAFSAISLVVISIWSINGFFSWRSYAKFAYEAQRIHPINLSELLNIENEPDKIATFTKIKNCNLVEIEMRNKSKYLLTYGGGSMTEVMNIVGRKGGKGIYKEPNTLLGLPLCFSPTSLQYQIYKSMRDGETAPNPNANNKNNQDNNTNNNWFPNPFQQDPKKIEVSLLDPKNQDNEALYYRSLMGIIETQIDLRDSAYQFSVPIDESMTRDICSSKYSVLEGLKGNGLPLGPEMNEKLNRLTTNMQC